jgi:hypothetical protein
MIGLFFSEVIMFVAAALIGFAIGWRLHELATGPRREADRQDVEKLRGDLAEAQVRRARNS